MLGQGGWRRRSAAPGGRPPRRRTASRQRRRTACDGAAGSVDGALPRRRGPALRHRPPPAQRDSIVPRRTVLCAHFFLSTHGEYCTRPCVYLIMVDLLGNIPKANIMIEDQPSKATMHKSRTSPCDSTPSHSIRCSYTIQCNPIGTINHSIESNITKTSQNIQIHTNASPYHSIQA